MSREEVTNRAISERLGLGWKEIGRLTKKASVYRSEPEVELVVASNGSSLMMLTRPLSFTHDAVMLTPNECAALIKILAGHLVREGI